MKVAADRFDARMQTLPREERPLRPNAGGAVPLPAIRSSFLAPPTRSFVSAEVSDRSVGGLANRERGPGATEVTASMPYAAACRSKAAGLIWPSVE